MMHSATMAPDLSPDTLRSDHRHDMELFALVEIDRSGVVDSFELDDGYEPDGVFATGAMRELCPHCKVNHLKLVLRQKRVRHAHLFCECCNKCFDARYSDGSSALVLDE